MKKIIGYFFCSTFIFMAGYASAQEKSEKVPGDESAAYEADFTDCSETADKKTSDSSDDLKTKLWQVEFDKCMSEHGHEMETEFSAPADYQDEDKSVGYGDAP